MEGRFLQAADTLGLRAEADRASGEGVAALFLSESALGDPIVLAAGLAPLLPRVLLGVRVGLGSGDRHPAVLARDMTCLDLVCEGRSVLCFGPPFTGGTADAIQVCRDLWHSSEAVGGGPDSVVQAPAGRARPAGEGSPLVALDLSGGDELPAFLLGAADLLLRPAAALATCRLERV